MPRKPKPGPRQNRTDLPPVAAPGGPTQAPRSATGQPYGSRKATLQSQAAVPLPDRSTDAMMSAAGAQGGGQGAGQDAAGLLPAFLDAARDAPSPGEGLLAGPSRRPGEPVTAGLSVGAGPGPDVLPPVPGRGPDPSVVLWADWLPALGLLASRPGSSPQVRQFYRRIRSQIPADYYERTEA